VRTLGTALFLLAAIVAYGGVAWGIGYEIGGVTALLSIPVGLLFGLIWCGVSILANQAKPGDLSGFFAVDDQGNRIYEHHAEKLKRQRSVFRIAFAVASAATVAVALTTGFLTAGVTGPAIFATVFCLLLTVCAGYLALAPGKTIATYEQHKLYRDLDVQRAAEARAVAAPEAIPTQQPHGNEYGEGTI